MKLDYCKAKEYLEDWSPKLSKLQKFAILSICKTLSEPKEKLKNGSNKDYLPNFSRRFGKRFIRGVFYDYKKLFELIKDNELLILTETKALVASIFSIGEKFLTDEMVKVPSDDLKYLGRMFEKRRKNGQKTITNAKISIEVSKEKLAELIVPYLMAKDPKKTKEELDHCVESQWNAVEFINLHNHVNPSRAIGARCSSKITQLSKPLDSLIRINGEETVYLDQHATYFTIIPRLIRESFKDEDLTNGLLEEVELLERMISKTDNIYKKIAKDQQVSILTIKGEMNSYLCKTNSHNYTKSIIHDWFQMRYPLIVERYKNLRYNGGQGRNLPRIESTIFSEAAKELKNLNIDVLTKYDSIIFLKRDILIVEKILKEKFKKERVIYKCKLTENLKENLTETKKTESEKEENLTESKKNLIAAKMQLKPQPAAGREGQRGGGVGGGTIMCDFLVGDIKNRVRQVDNHGSLSWMYKGRRSQQLLRSCKKYTKEQVIQEITQKFESGEWR